MTTIRKLTTKNGGDVWIWKTPVNVQFAIFQDAFDTLDGYVMTVNDQSYIEFPEGPCLDGSRDKAFLGHLKLLIGNYIRDGHSPLPVSIQIAESRVLEDIINKVSNAEIFGQQPMTAIVPEPQSETWGSW